jgi:hypothetical protein
VSVGYDGTADVRIDVLNGLPFEDGSAEAVRLPSIEHA